MYAVRLQWNKEIKNRKVTGKILTILKINKHTG